jgi:hypothetical protein
MTGPSSSEITQLLHAWRGGDRLALQRLTPVVYEELRRMARHYMVRERDGHTPQTTSLINEVYLRFFGGLTVDETAEVRQISGEELTLLRNPNK